jgi:conjugative relaxase-like TrwC/TraI family protein
MLAVATTASEDGHECQRPQHASCTEVRDVVLVVRGAHITYVMSLHRLSGGSGFRYLMRHTASADQSRPPGVGLTEYYAASGNPAGRWLGSGLAGLAGLASGGLAPGTVVTEPAMSAVFRGAVDPFTGQLLGRAPSAAGVAGFDLTFTVPKSVSVLWGLGDSHIRESIEVAHHAAVADVLTVIEGRALQTRTGAGGAQRMATYGAVAAAFDHYDSRAHDPHLHTHLAIANRVQGVDGRWRTIDARDLHAGAVAFSELYDGLLGDRLAAALPVTFSWRDRGGRRAPAFEADGVGDAMLADFSSRAASIDTAVVDLLKEFHDAHGRAPGRVETIRLRQRATLATRPVKTVHSLTELRAHWRQRAESGGRSVDEALATALAGEVPAPTVSSPITLDQLAGAVVAAVAERRSTWTTWNLAAEAARALKTHRFAGPADRLAATDTVTAAARHLCVALHDSATVGPAAGRARWTSAAVLDAETRLLAAAGEASAPIANVHGHTPGLSADQNAALLAAAGSGRRIDVLVGPAGSGKTTLLRTLATYWQWTHGVGSVVGLAPSSAAAEELRASLRVPCENTAKWLHETSARPNPRTRWSLRPGQLLIVDEASLASTPTLDALVRQAQQADAKVLLVGDHHQLAAVEAGGAFGLLARRTGAPELTALWRFRERWEAEASRGLRRGNPTALDSYEQHGRLHGGTHDETLDKAFKAWASDRAAGRDSLLLAPDGETVTQLNARARSERVLAGESAVDGVHLRDGTTAGEGDTIVSRLNARRLTDRTGRFVRNGDSWTVVRRTPRGDLGVVPAGETPNVVDDAPPLREGFVWLPSAYVAEHVELGYAVTIHRAQGRTVDTCHVVAGPGMAREHLYVAMTRGREANHVYLAADQPGPDGETHRGDSQLRSGREIAVQILRTTTAEPSATEALDSVAAARDQAVWGEPQRHRAEPAPVRDAPSLTY